MPDDAQMREVVDPSQGDLPGYDAFVWHDSTIGLKHRTESLGEAIAFDAEQAKILERIDPPEVAAQFARRITDESGAILIGHREVAVFPN